MNCPTCDITMSFDEPKLGFSVYVCEECDFCAQYNYGELVYTSQPDEPMKPSVASMGLMRKKEAAISTDEHGRLISEEIPWNGEELVVGYTADQSCPSKPLGGSIDVDYIEEGAP